MRWMASLDLPASTYSRNFSLEFKTTFIGQDEGTVDGNLFSIVSFYCLHTVQKVKS